MRGCVPAVFVTCLSVAAASTGNLYLLKDAAAAGAVCLDGTPGGYHYAPGFGDGVQKWHIHHQGGGWCADLESCYARSKTKLGSSTFFPPTMGFETGYFSTNSTINPQMYNWNMVYARYCDGGSFTGNNETVTNFNGTSLYFRGHRILNAIIEDLLKNRGLASATDVVVSGDSAGGLATFLHIDQWAASMPSTVNKIVAMPDSGFFLDYQGVPPGPTHGLPPRQRRVSRSVFEDEELDYDAIGLSDFEPGMYEADMQWVFQYQNSTSGVDEDCIAAYTPSNQQWKCIFAEHTSPFIRTPVFPLQSEYDSFQIHHVLQANTSALVQELGSNITTRLTNSLLINPANGVFLDSCVHHVGYWGDIQIDGQVQAQAFQQWYDDPAVKRAWIQDKPYPCDACCSL